MRDSVQIAQISAARDNLAISCEIAGLGEIAFCLGRKDGLSHLSDPQHILEKTQ